jgi:xylulokinase
MDGQNVPPKPVSRAPHFHAAHDMSATPKALVGIDVGTTGVKTLAVSSTGKVLARAEEPYPLSTPHPGWAEQNPDDWVHATRKALARLGVQPEGIGLSGQMHGLVCLDARQHVLRPAILWNDQRTGRQCAEIEDRLGFERLISLTGNRALAGFTAPKLLWIREYEPAVYARVSHILLPKDYVRLRLTGERATDVADASGTLLLDVGARRWSSEVVEALEFNPGWLPPVFESPEVCAEMDDGVPVAAGAGDQAAGAIGVGADRPGPLSIVLGTSGVVFAALPRFAYDPKGRSHSFCHAVPGGWHSMGVMLSAAGSLAWLQLLFGTSYDDLLQEAEQTPPGADGALFAPYLSGERTPYADPDVRGAFAGLALGQRRGNLVRAVLEGVAFGLRDSLELLRELGVTAEVGRLSGGGARSDLWARIVASVLGLPLERTAVEEGAAFGAALLGGVAAHVFGDVHEAVEACVHIRETIEPVAEWTDVYNDLYGQFRSLYPAVVSLRNTIERRPAGSTPTEMPRASS